MKRIVILTGSELRHDYLRMRLGCEAGIEVLASYCEGTEKSLQRLAHDKGEGEAELELRHLARRQQVEQDFFGLFVRHVADRSRPTFMEKGAINRGDHVEAIVALEPDVLVAYGCSIVKRPLIEAFEGRFVNVHLGLSPYYRGAGTNFWPFANGEPEYAGLTFMHIDPGVDTGAIIHQVRPRVFAGDSFHQVGNRLIADMAGIYAGVVRRWDELEPMPQPAEPEVSRLYRNRDFDDGAVVKLYRQLDAGLIDRYVDEREARCHRVPIVEHPRLAGALADESRAA